ncbi:hypothetical protein D9M71_209430 [compost metagenome]
MAFARAEADRRIVAQHRANRAALLVFHVLGGVGRDVEGRLHHIAITQHAQPCAASNLATAVGLGYAAGVAVGVDVQLAQGQGAVAVQAAQDDHPVLFAGHQAAVGQQALQGLLQGEPALQCRGAAAGQQLAVGGDGDPGFAGQGMHRGFQGLARQVQAQGLSIGGQGGGVDRAQRQQAGATQGTGQRQPTQGTGESHRVCRAGMGKRHDLSLQRWVQR